MSEKFEVKTEVREKYVVVEVNLKENIEAQDLQKLVDEVEKTIGNDYYGKGVVISGRMPIWSHSALAHLFHPANWVAHFDPRVQGAVVTQSHVSDIKIGDVIKL